MLQYWNSVKEFTGENPNVVKFVFEKDDAVAEAVLYKYESYEKRTVLCISVQSGCPVGCVFCGTGKKFIRNLTNQEIFDQAKYIIDWIELKTTIAGSSFRNTPLNSRCEKLQIMFMSMGEPMLNWGNVLSSILSINGAYPSAQLLISTIGVNDPKTFKGICEWSRRISKIGLQFSLHSAYETERNEIIPFQNKMNVREIRDAGLLWNKFTNRPVYLNICINNEKINMQYNECERIMDLFPPSAFHLTFSTVCEFENGKVKDSEEKDFFEFLVQPVMQRFIKEGYNVRKFDPAGQDDIGAGCGQLWYTQEWMKANKQ